MIDKFIFKIRILRIFVGRPTGDARTQRSLTNVKCQIYALRLERERESGLGYRPAPLKSDFCGCAPINDSESENGESRLTTCTRWAFTNSGAAAAAVDAKEWDSGCVFFPAVIPHPRSAIALPRSVRSYFRWPPAEEREREFLVRRAPHFPSPKSCALSTSS